MLTDTDKARLVGAFLTFCAGEVIILLRNPGSLIYFAFDADELLLYHTDVKNTRICTSSLTFSSWCAT
jgi:hypothetical protein